MTFDYKQKTGACSVTGRFAASSQASRKYGYITLSGGIPMNREHKKKTFEKGYSKTHPCNDTFICKFCGKTVVPTGAGNDHRDHCP
ncbi:RNHCP domain-containing protein [Ruminococcus flavefaciens]|uniref:RNHCP domain-containing protein n=1 Tax=Ruminococcus flavefaciens TaxID=1265 RepID=UPI00350E5239